MFLDLGNLDLTEFAVLNCLFNGLVSRGNTRSGIRGDDRVIIVARGGFGNGVATVGKPSGNSRAVCSGGQVRDD